MSDLLLVLGMICIGVALWKGRSQSAVDHKELQEFKQVRDDLVDAKKEVGCLLEQLERVSESVVESISVKIEEARELESTTAGDDLATDIQGAKLDNPKETSNVEHVDEEETSEAEQDDKVETSDAERDSEAETSDAEQVVKDSVARMRKRTANKNGNKIANKGRTIVFPLVNEGSIEKGASRTARKEPVRELPPKQQMVYAMAKLGYSEAEIAKQMKIGKGEVNLMLELKRKGEEANG